MNKREERRRRFIASIERAKKEYMKDPWVRRFVDAMSKALDGFEKFLKAIDEKGKR